MDRFEAGWLFDFYGPLLTPHRQQVLRLYLEEDLSLGEIARQTGITRQGVHDALRNAQAQLADYESKLGLLERYRTVHAQVAFCMDCLSRVRPLPGARRRWKRRRRRWSAFAACNDEESR